MASKASQYLEAILDNIEDVNIVLFCNRANSPVMKLAQNRGVPVVYVPLKSYRGSGFSREMYDSDVGRQVMQYKPDLVVLAGWMHIFSQALLDSVSSRTVINLHASLLPDSLDDDRVCSGRRHHIPKLRHFVRF